MEGLRGTKNLMDASQLCRSKNGLVGANDLKLDKIMQHVDLIAKEVQQELEYGTGEEAISVNKNYELFFGHSK